MKRSAEILFLSMVVSSFMIVSLVYAQQNKFKLKPDAKGKLCLNCHENFKEKLSDPFVHTPVRTGECSECHNPHSASHGKLLEENANRICFKCHEEMMSKDQKSSHRVVIEGNCVKCHDPHASKNKFVLLKAGNELCFDCHKNIGSAIAKARFKHNPVEKGCTNCHDPHSSAKVLHLLKNDLVALCVGCHQTDRPAFAKQHMNYPVEKSNCSSCHNAHGSDRGGILFDNVHQPVANKICTQCHEASNSPTPLKTRRAGYELCRGCHSSMMNDTFNKNRIHWPLVDKTGCLNCHEPHASKEKKLLLGDSKSLCGKCHSDTMEVQVKLAEKEAQEKATAKGKVIKGALTHAPIQEGNCDACHDSHAADSVFLLKQPPVIKLCEACHDWSKHSNHPMGEKVVDTRNKNITMQCLSCHRSHGTGYRYMIQLPTVTDLCVQCHKQFKR